MIVSACLLGIKCRYDGNGCYCPRVEKLLRKYTLIPVCPEVLGGMTVPREPVEIANGRAKNKSGEDKTDCFSKGARETLRLAKKFKVKKAFLKSGSPSCGCDLVYDGTFSGRIIPGKGFAAEILEKNGIETFSENTAERY